jgi:hypothetical protein
MARVRAVATTEGEVALTAATAKTVLQLVAPSNHCVAVKGFSISFDGTSSSAEPVQVDILRQSTAGTSSAGTPVEETLTGVTLQTTSRITVTVEPTAGNVLRRYDVHPQTGILEKFTLEDEILLGSAGRLGIRCTAPANVNCLAHFSFEE